MLLAPILIALASSCGSCEEKVALIVVFHWWRHWSLFLRDCEEIVKFVILRLWLEIARASWETMEWLGEGTRDICDKKRNFLKCLEVRLLCIFAYASVWGWLKYKRAVGWYQSVNLTNRLGLLTTVKPSIQLFAEVSSYVKCSLRKV